MYITIIRRYVCLKFINPFQTDTCRYILFTKFVNRECIGHISNSYKEMNQNEYNKAIFGPVVMSIFSLVVLEIAGGIFIHNTFCAHLCFRNVICYYRLWRLAIAIGIYNYLFIAYECVGVYVSTAACFRFILN